MSAIEEPKKVVTVTTANWSVIAILALFTLVSAIGGAASVVTMVEHHSPVVLLGYAIAGGIFIAASVVVLLQIVSFSMSKS